ncbi:MAG TPA: fatty acid desaturase family protein [Polaromonas sp.]|uniref:fatty acid desaturase family protein n=1 Tax=Polaromonas sp. TaxID=1869339 RepID=UPI002D624B3D|nr:fatty acid desaturase family protein [Polaromonas sp.]HYW58158.1 fatty acid desaturase family protein [Polaromonas sp.]
MPAAARVQADTFFGPDEWKALSARSSWKGIAVVAHCWLVIGAAMAVGIVWPLSIPLMVMIIGNRQLGLFILMHDAAHGLLHANRAINDRLALWFCGHELNIYRPYHLQHHRFVQQSEDPDLVLSAPFPITPDSLRRKIIRDLTGQTFFKQRFGGLIKKLKARPNGEAAWPLIGAALKQQRIFLITNGLGLALFSAAGLWWAWVLMWLLPMATWLPLVSRLRNIAEHALIDQNGTDPLRHARTTHANLLERLFIAPYWVNYHCEHHMFTQIPCWNLPRAHKLLKAKGVLGRMEMQPGYATVLRLASAG